MSAWISDAMEIRLLNPPHIDKLASKGLRFQQAFLTSPQSSPSRTSMMTGMFAHTIGTEDLHTPIDDQTLIMPTFFKDGGYYTGTMLKKHWGENGDKQFDYVITDLRSPYELDLTEEKYKEYENFFDQANGKPFFLWVGFNDPHRPYDRTTCPQKNDPALIPVPPYLVDGPETRRDLADYYDEITRMDNHIGRMIEGLEKRGLMENTIIVFLSDNGMPFPRSKGSLYDSGIQTPLIFMWKNKINEGAVHANGLISSIDLAATLLDCAGISKPDHMYGESFKKILFNPELRGREYIFAERNWHDTDEYIRCIRTEKYKLIYNAYYELPHGTATDLSTSPSWCELKKKQRSEGLHKNQMQIFTAPRPMVEMYDLEKDPYELDNVADLEEYVREGEELAKILVDWQQETKDHPWWTRRRGDRSDRVTGFPFPNRRSEMWGN